MGHPGAHTALQKHLGGGHGGRPRAIAEPWEAIGMSQQRVQTCDGEGTGWDDSPGKVTRGKRKKEEALAPGRLERELHPSPRQPACGGCRQARDWIRWPRRCLAPGEGDDGCRKAGRLCKKAASATAASREPGDSKRLGMTGRQICLLGYSSVRQALLTTEIGMIFIAGV